MPEKNFIDEYVFGKITIQGKSYEKDLKIISKKVKPNWWRNEGHILCMQDIIDVIQAKPKVLIIGCGYDECMKVPDALLKVLNNQGIQVFVESTQNAVDRFNKISNDPTVCAVFHLTC